MTVIGDLMAFCRLQQTIDDQRERVDMIVRDIRPLSIVDKDAAVARLLETFMSDGGERASTVAAFAVLALAEARTTIAALEAPWPSEAQQVALVAFAMGEHEYAVDHCHPTPGVHCASWCTACKLLAGLPSEVLDAAIAKRAENDR